jgi:site-specific DNA-methyltransferase (cytosine-N4-specific)
MTEVNKVLHGNCMDLLDAYPNSFFSMIVTSPPYYQVRTYPIPPYDWGDWVGCLGDEPTVKMYVEHMVRVCAKLYRVLRNDGLFWLNIGDTYPQRSAKRATKEELAKNRERTKTKEYPTNAYAGHYGQDRAAGGGEDIRPQNLSLSPERLIVALQDWGWNVNSKPNWWKRNGLVASAPNRPAPDYEHVYMLSKSTKYFYNREAVHKPPLPGEEARAEGSYEPYLRTTWDIPTQPSPTSHSSTFPDMLARTCILLGSANKVCGKCMAPFKPFVVKGDFDLQAARRMGGDLEGGYSGTEQKDYKCLKAQEPSKTKSRILKSLQPRIVADWEPTCQCFANYTEAEENSTSARILDPFMGSGTTGFVAIQEGRTVCGIEADSENVSISETAMTFAQNGMDRKSANQLLKILYGREKNEDSGDTP